MFEVGDRVMVNCFMTLMTPKEGKIMGWFYDEGNVWMVYVKGSGTIHCCDSELTPIVVG